MRHCPMRGSAPPPPHVHTRHVYDAPPQVRIGSSVCGEYQRRGAARGRACHTPKGACTGCKAQGITGTHKPRTSHITPPPPFSRTVFPPPPPPAHKPFTFRRQFQPALSVFVGLHQSIHISFIHTSFSQHLLLVFQHILFLLCASVHLSHFTQLASAFLLCTLIFLRPLVHQCSVFNTLGLELCTIHAVFGELRLAINASPVLRPLWCNAFGGRPPCLKTKGRRHGCHGCPPEVP